MEKDTNSSLPKRNNPTGLALVSAGAIFLIVSFFAGWTTSNLVLLGGLILIILGVILHVIQQKKQEKY